MKKSLAHLPKHKRDDLKLVTEITLDECPTVLMIVLFGSCARGDWVEDTYVENGITYEYASDFDLLVIVRSNRIVNNTDTWRRAEARAHFREWYTSAKDFYLGFEFYLRKRKLTPAAFQLHQVGERFYDAILLVFTNYRPKLHDLEKLTHMVAGHDPAFLTVFPQATPEQKECFNLLKRAYVEARYNPGYEITKAQLEYSPSG